MHIPSACFQTSLCSVIAAHLLVSSGGIREKYKGQEGEDVRNAKVVELVSLDQSAEQANNCS